MTYPLSCIDRKKSLVATQLCIYLIIIVQVVGALSNFKLSLVIMLWMSGPMILMEYVEGGIHLTMCLLLFLN